MFDLPSVTKDTSLHNLLTNGGDQFTASCLCCRDGHLFSRSEGNISAVSDLPDRLFHNIGHAGKDTAWRGPTPPTLRPRFASDTFRTFNSTGMHRLPATSTSRVGNHRWTLTSFTSSRKQTKGILYRLLNSFHWRDASFFSLESLNVVPHAEAE